MNIRYQVMLGVLSVGLFVQAAQAGLLDAFSNKDVTTGLKQALEQGASRAVDTLGTTDGFLGNAEIKIPLPKTLQQAEPILRAMGKGKQMDDLVVAMNRAAESAVSEAKPLLVNAVKQMSVKDAKGILSGGDNSVTNYFRNKTLEPLTQRFLPVVTKATSRFQLAEKYNQLAAQGAIFGLIKQEDANVERYVTRLALGALYNRIAEEERAIRENPAEALGSIAQKVFGAMGR